MTAQPQETIRELIAGLTKAQKRAILWCNSDGAPRDHEKGSPAEVSFYVMAKVIKGDPKREVALIYSLVQPGENKKRKRGLWPMTTWALTPLGLEVQAALRAKDSSNVE